MFRERWKPAVFGYFAGGYDGSSFKTRCDKLTFSTSTTASNTVGDLSVARH